MTMAQMALRWILDYEAVSVIIPGASRPEQVRSNASASLPESVPPLGELLHARLRTYYEQNVRQWIRGPY
jgi:aryl-alcohol dehydrogenase-like predicted oxidoreductase